MTLHCVSRLGVLNKIYQNRNDITFIIGLIDEVPIALCNSEYDFSKELVIKLTEDHKSLPSVLTTAQEINLFHCSTLLLINPSYYQIAENRKGYLVLNSYNEPPTLIFHPPLG